MAYFPFFVDLEGKTGLIIGGGRTALGKARRLLNYGPALTVIAPEALPELASLPGVRLIRREFDERDLDGAPFFVVAATDSAAVNREISRLCREKRIPVNAVDMPEDCTFLFPALVKRDSLSIGVSTGGASPVAAAYLKEKIGEILPENIGAILDFLQAQREPVKRRIREEAARKAVFQALFRESLRFGRPLTAEETEAVITKSEEA